MGEASRISPEASADDPGRKIADKDALQRAKVELCRRYALPGVPRNSETLAFASEEEYPFVVNILRRKPVRTLSGVAVVAVMTSPAPARTVNAYSVLAGWTTTPRNHIPARNQPRCEGRTTGSIRSDRSAAAWSS